jgi:hypothetical protein
MLKEKFRAGPLGRRTVGLGPEFQIFKELENLIKVDKDKVETQICLMVLTGSVFRLRFPVNSLSFPDSARHGFLLQKPVP